MDAETLFAIRDELMNREELVRSYGHLTDYQRGVRDAIDRVAIVPGIITVSDDNESDGQLCPYADCAWWLGLACEGWYECPHCAGLFYACAADGDYEDYHCYPESAEHPHPPDGTPIAIAIDLGPSWASGD